MMATTTIRPKLTLKSSAASLQEKLNKNSVITEKVLPESQNNVEKPQHQEQEHKEQLEIQSIKKVEPTLPIKPEFKHILEPKIYKQILKILQNTYPHCFTIPPKPLAVNIHLSLIETKIEDISKTMLRKFLVCYCRTKNYKDGLQLGADRVDLQGNVTACVTAEEMSINIQRNNDSHR
jgi:hypothetical protein